MPALATPCLEHNGLTLAARRYQLHPGSGATIKDDGIVDDVAIKRRLEGDQTVQLTPREIPCLVWDAVHAGMQDAEIADLFGRCRDDGGRSWVQRVRRLNDIPPCPPRWDEDELCRLLVDQSAVAIASEAKKRAAGLVERNAA